MRRSGSVLVLLLAAVGCDDDATNPPVNPVVDGGGPGPVVDADFNPGEAASGAACTVDGDCYGGTCLGRPGGFEADNPRFAGGYCTTLGCTADSQDGCGADEWCIDAGFATMCVEMCSKADGVTCDRADHVCLGLGTWGGCFSEETVECTRDHTGGDCAADQLCVSIGFDDLNLGRCETLCDPMSPTACAAGQACYYIRRYNVAFCALPGARLDEETCTCDKCCLEDSACTPDLDGSGRHCKPYCLVSAGCPAGTCVPIEADSPWGGCVLPGSQGT